MRRDVPGTFCTFFLYKVHNTEGWLIESMISGDGVNWQQHGPLTARGVVFTTLGSSGTVCDVVQGHGAQNQPAPRHLTHPQYVFTIIPHPQTHPHNHVFTMLFRAMTLNTNLLRAISRTPGTGHIKERQDDEYGRLHASGLHVTGRIIINLWRVLRAEVGWLGGV